jgi:hypothetical protein
VAVLASPAARSRRVAGFWPLLGNRGAQTVTCGALLGLDGVSPSRCSRDPRPYGRGISPPDRRAGVDVEWSLRLDTLSGVMILVVTIVRDGHVSIPSATWRTIPVSRASWPISSLFTFSCWRWSRQRLRATVFRLKVG